ncbi:MAG: DNA polymerase III subunit epsilon [Casimicrobiaceae bacterium]
MPSPDRILFLDTETTGFDPKLGHRLIEVAAVEARDRKLTGRYFHRYINPERDSDEGALKVHGLTREFLSDKPKFADIAAELVDFITGARLHIHNAAFDIGFLDAEFARLGLPRVAELDVEIVDTVMLARSLYPGKKNSLDALCERLGVNHSERTLHGALLDARLLAEVFFAMTRGQASLDMSVTPAADEGRVVDAEHGASDRLPLVLIEVDAESLERHLAYLAGLSAGQTGQSLWNS